LKEEEEKEVAAHFIQFFLFFRRNARVRARGKTEMEFS
jgi:hypothetical protein